MLEKEKLRSKTWFVILMLCIFFPVGLYMMWKYQKFNKFSRILITVFFVLAGIVSIGNNENDSDITSDEVKINQEYGSQAIEVYMILKSSLGNMNFLFDSPVMDDAWFDNVEKQMSNISSAKKTFESLEPPKDYEEMHETFKESFEHYEIGNAHLYALFNGWEESHPNITEPTDLIDLAKKEYVEGALLLEKYEQLIHEKAETKR